MVKLTKWAGETWFWRHHASRTPLSSVGHVGVEGGVEGISLLCNITQMKSRGWRHLFALLNNAWMKIRGWRHLFELRNNTRMKSRGWLHLFAFRNNAPMIYLRVDGTSLHCTITPGWRCFRGWQHLFALRNNAQMKIFRGLSAPLCITQQRPDEDFLGVDVTSLHYATTPWWRVEAQDTSLHCITSIKSKIQRWQDWKWMIPYIATQNRRALG